MRTFGASLVLKRIPGKDQPGSVLRRVLEEWYEKRRSVPLGSASALEEVRTESRREGRSLQRFEYVQATDEGAAWSTTVRILEDEAQLDQVATAIEMSIEDVADRLAPLRVEVRPPGFLRSLRDECAVFTIDGFEAPSRVLGVYGSGAADALAKEIFSPDRKMPLVVVTDPIYETKLIKDLPRKLATSLFALGRVVHVTPRMTFELTDAVGRELTVFDGAVRIYWPGAKQGDLSPQHPLFLRRVQATWGSASETIEGELTKRLVQAIVRAAAPRFRLPPAMQEFERQVERDRLEASSATLQDLKRAVAERDELVTAAREMEQLALSENQRIVLTLQAMEQDLKSTREALRSERQKAAALQDALRQRGGSSGPVVTLPEPASAEEAVERGRVAFAEQLVLPDDIILETDLGPSVYQVLEAMSEACKAERDGAVRDRTLFQDRLAEHLGHPGRYEPGPTGVFHEVDGKLTELKDRIHLRNARPADTETVYFAPMGESRDRRMYLIARIGRHA